MNGLKAIDGFDFNDYGIFYQYIEPKLTVIVYPFVFYCAYCV